MGDSLVSGEQGDYTITRAIIEDFKTGKVYEVQPMELQFIGELERSEFYEQRRAEQVNKVSEKWSGTQPIP